MCFISILRINAEVCNIIQIETEKFTSLVFEKTIILARFGGQESENVLTCWSPVRFFSPLQRKIAWRIHLPLKGVELTHP